MKKKWQLLVFIIPLMLFPLIKVGADNNTNGTREITLKQTTGIPININGINNQNIHHGSLYKIELEYQVALCLDPNHPISLGGKYKYLNKIDPNSSWKNTLLVRAYLYAVYNKNDIVARAASQIVSWKWGEWSQMNATDSATILNSDLYRAFLQGLKNFKSSFRTRRLEGEDGEAFLRIKEILETPVPSNIFVGVWQDINHPNNQRVLAYGVEDKVAPVNNENCKQVTYSNLSNCHGTYSTYGYAYQTTEGKCLKGYDSAQNNKYSIYGAMESANVGSYCRMYCNKFFYEILPGNIANSINVGRYLVWPNNNVENNRYKINANLSEHPMALAIEKNCRISVDTNKITKDYTTALTNYNTYINRNRGIYNTYVSDGRTCTTYQNDYNAKNAAATRYCSTVGADPGCHDEPYTCCSGPAPKDKKGNVIGPCPTTTCHNCVDNPGRAAWRARVAECNRLRGIANEAANKLNTCNGIQNYVNAVANVINEYNTCIGYKASFNLGFSAPGVNASFDDDEYGKTMNLKETKKAETCQGCYSGIGGLSITKYNVETNLSTNGTLVEKANAVNAREIIGTSTIYYDLDDNYYYYVNKDNNKSVNSNSGLRNYSVIGFSNMPISYNASSKRNYNLKITIPMLTGDASVFTNLVARHNYVCHYKITKTTLSDCVCPEGTKHAGESLECLSKDNNGTCLDNQMEYCDSDSNIPHTCTSDNITCPSDTGVDLSSCISAGKTYSWCVSKFCSSYPDPNPDVPGNQRWVCPSGTNEGMDLSSCVMPMMVQGYSERQAYEYCRDVTCPYNGIKIIYRVIDLTNPFPSKDADSRVTQGGLTVGMFNDELKGRYPGTNWNSVKTVKSKILNNRNTDGDKVYNKEPMYHFVLNSERIRAIRNYNSRQSDRYADFTLNCLESNSKCVSSFVHNATLSGLTGGTCRNITRNSFATCGY